MTSLMNEPGDVIQVQSGGTAIPKRAIDGINEMIRNSVIKADSRDRFTWRCKLDDHEFELTFDRKGDIVSGAYCDAAGATLGPRP